MDSFIRKSIWQYEILISAIEYISCETNVKVKDDLKTELRNKESDFLPHELNKSYQNICYLVTDK